MKPACFAAVALLLPPLSAHTQTGTLPGQAAHVTITRDNWGIAHVHGERDRDAVFGMIYAQCGGESGHPGSPHFNDQAERYAQGDLREVWFYPDQLKHPTERTYRPGQLTTR